MDIDELILHLQRFVDNGIASTTELTALRHLRELQTICGAAVEFADRMPDVVYMVMAPYSRKLVEALVDYPRRLPTPPPPTIPSGLEGTPEGDAIVPTSPMHQ